MKTLINKSLVALMIATIYITPVYATEIVDINDTEAIQEVLSQQPTSEVEVTFSGATVQRDERMEFEGYTLPETVEHNIGKMDAEGLALLEMLSICGMTSEFHLTLDNSTQSVIPYNYLNMLSNNYTPFTFYLENDGRQVASIYTNGVTATEGNFPAHMNIAQGIDFIQLSFDADAVITGEFVVEFNCYEFIGYSYNVYEGETIVNTGKVDSSGKLSFRLSDFNTKTVKFFIQHLDNVEEITQEEATEEVTAQTEVIAEENKSPLKQYLPFILGGAGIIGIAGCIIGIFVMQKKKHK